MKWLLAIPLAIWAQSAFAEAPFCAVTSMGSQCQYYSLSACRQALIGMDGSCVVNPAAATQASGQSLSVAPTPMYSAPVVQSPNVLGSFLQGAQAGQQSRQSREEREARMRLAEAEVAAIQRQSAPIVDAPAIDTSTGEGLAKACGYVAKVGDPQWAPANEQQMILGLGFAMECKGFINGLIGGASTVTKGAGARPFCLNSTGTVHEVAAALAAGVSVLPDAATQPALAYTLTVLGARWKCPEPGVAGG